MRAVGPEREPGRPVPGDEEDAGGRRAPGRAPEPVGVNGRSPTRISRISAWPRPGATRTASASTSRTPAAVVWGAKPEPVSRVAPATTRLSGHATR